MYLDRVVRLLWAGRASESHSRFPAVMSCSGWWPRLWAQVKRSPRHRHTAREGRGSSSRADWLTVSRGLSFARCEVPAGMITTPAKHSHHVVGETLPAAGRPLSGTQQCLFQRRAKHLQCVESHLPFAMLSSRSVLTTSRSSSVSHADI
jgi:hypothetical protein